MKLVISYRDLNPKLKNEQKEGDIQKKQRETNYERGD